MTNNTSNKRESEENTRGWVEMWVSNVAMSHICVETHATVASYDPKHHADYKVEVQETTTSLLTDGRTLTNCGGTQARHLSIL